MRSSVAGRPRPANLARQVQRVLHVARGMLGRHVQRVEVVPLVLDLRALDDWQPMRVKIASICSRTIVRGWRWPSGGVRPGSVTSTAPAGAWSPRAPPCAR